MAAALGLFVAILAGCGLYAAYDSAMERSTYSGATEAHTAEHGRAMSAASALLWTLYLGIPVFALVAWLAGH